MQSTSSNNLNNSLKVSILTRCKNNARYLASCIESVIAQDYPLIEHIIQDACSTDETQQILSRYDLHINALSEQDLTRADGLNKALKRCTGQVIVILDPENELHTSACSWAVSQFESNSDAAVVYGNYYNIDSKGKVVSEHVIPVPYRYDRLVCLELVIPSQTAFIRRSAWEQAGIYLDTTLWCCSEYELWLRVGLHSSIHYDSTFICSTRVELLPKQNWKSHLNDMRNSYKDIMDRAFNDRTSLPGLHRLKRRAYSGLNRLSADKSLEQGDLFRGLGFLFLSLIMYPVPSQWKRLPVYLLDCLRTIVLRRTVLGIELSRDLRGTK